MLIMITEIFLTIFPIFPMLWLFSRAESLYNIAKKDRWIKNIKIKINKITDLWPSVLEKNIKKSYSGPKASSVDGFMSAYQKVIHALCVYVLFCLAHLILIVARLAWAFQNRGAYLTEEGFIMVLQFVCISIVLSYVFFIEPAGRLALGKEKFEFIESLIEKEVERIIDWAKRGILDIGGFFLSFFMIYAYVNFVEHCIKIDYTLWMSLIVLMAYQYIILAAISFILRLILKKISLRMRPDSNAGCFLQRYAKSNLLYETLKNGTYLSLVLVYILAEKSNSGASIVIGALFLLDTYFEKSKYIRNSTKTRDAD